MFNASTNRRARLTRRTAAFLAAIAAGASMNSVKGLDARPEPPIVVKQTDASREVLLQHDGPYWSLAKTVTRVMDLMESFDEKGPLFIQYSGDPVGRSPGQVTVFVGFFTSRSIKVPAPFQFREQPSGLVACQVVEGLAGNVVQQYGPMRAWIAAHGYRVLGSIVEVYEPLAPDDPASRQRTEIRMPIRAANAPDLESPRSRDSIVKPPEDGAPVLKAGALESPSAANKPFDANPAAPSAVESPDPSTTIPSVETAASATRTAAATPVVEEATGTPPDVGSEMIEDATASRPPEPSSPSPEAEDSEVPDSAAPRGAHKRVVIALENTDVAETLEKSGEGPRSSGIISAVVADESPSDPPIAEQHPGEPAPASQAANGGVAQGLPTQPTSTDSVPTGDHTQVVAADPAPPGEIVLRRLFLLAEQRSDADQVWAGHLALRVQVMAKQASRSGSDGDWAALGRAADRTLREFGPRFRVQPQSRPMVVFPSGDPASGRKAAVLRGMDQLLASVASRPIDAQVHYVECVTLLERAEEELSSER